VNVARLIARAKVHELAVAPSDGVHKPYQDTEGVWTIGYGRNLDDNGISEAEAVQMLRHDMQTAIEEAHDEWEQLWPESSVRQEVLIEMMFNMGRTRFRRSRWPGLTRALERGDYVKAAVEMLDSKWARQVKGRAVALSKLMERGVDA